MGYVPAYSWFASRVDRMKLVLGVTAFFTANILLFALAVGLSVDHMGVFFYVWVGIFSLAAALLLATAGLYRVVNRGGTAARQAAVSAKPLGGRSGFSLVFASRYIGLIAFLLVLLNVVNTVGEYILSRLVVAHAAEAVRADPAFDKNAYIGSFYGSYYLWFNVTAVLLQAFVASRLVKRFGLAGVLFALPFVSLGAYGFVALEARGFAALNVAFVVLWLLVAVVLVRENHRLSSAQAGSPEA